METFELKSGQQLGQRTDWLPESKQPIRSQESSLTQLLTMITTLKFPPKEKRRKEKRKMRAMLSVNIVSGEFEEQIKTLSC